MEKYESSEVFSYIIKHVYVIISTDNGTLKVIKTSPAESLPVLAYLMLF